MFVAMFVLLLATVMVAGVSLNFSNALNSVETTEFRYLSLGATNELLSELNAGLERDTYTRGNPRRVKEGGRIIESWVEPLEENEKFVFVVARTFRSGGGKPQVVKKLAMFREHTLARVYTNVTDTDKANPDPVYYSDLSSSGAWSQLPDLSRTRYTNAGTLETKTGQVAGTLPYVSGAPDGSMYVVYAPTLDGWDDKPSPAYFFGIPIPIVLPWGDLALHTIVNGGRKGLTVGDLTPVAQVLIGHVTEVTVSKGAIMMKYSHDDGAWTPLPPAEEAALVGSDFVVDPGNYHLQGVAGPPMAHDKGLTVPLYRKGQDSIYQYSHDTEQWSVVKPPGEDVMLLTTEQSGDAVYVQTGKLQPVGPGYLLNIIAIAAGLGDENGIYANTSTSALHRYADGEWTPVPDPPARYFDKSGELKDRSYGARGPTLSGMVGGDDGELYVVNRPPQGSGLVDTVWRYHERVWEVVPSPPNKYFDSAGTEVEGSGLPQRLEPGVGLDGQLILRVPTRNGADAIFLKTDEGYDLLPPVHADGGPFEQFLSQISGGAQRDGSGRGGYTVKATYF